MQNKIRSFAIEGLYGKFDVKIPMIDNRIIIVGANGLGKSTCINAFYYLLSRQWSRLAELDFERVVIESSLESVALTKADVETFTLADEPGRVPHNVLQRALHLDPRSLEEFLESGPSEIGRFRELLNYPNSVLREIQSALRGSLRRNGALEKAAEVIRELVSENQILYLPTYRRIEKDLKALVDREETRRNRIDAEFIRKLGFRTDVYAELVEFGMEDVKIRLSETLSALNDNNRKEFNALAGSYLRDVIKGEGQTYSAEEISSLTGEEVTRILRRVEENTLSWQEKALLTQALDRLRSQSPKDSDSYVAHFLTKLVRSAENLARREKPVTDFVRTCNSYLDGKELVYDELSYRVFVRETGTDGREIDLPFLSSGEKQVVSLFAHLYLSERKYLIVIDEPELSLSVTWQKTFLPDIWASGNCTYMAAVTHSPFIFDNDFEKYTFDMKDGMRRNG
ncbi:AAA family ATPase [Granulicella sp. L60]|uniref:AAA family ATPase n=1 Tax=Granulicella sp. L60 TaxID=1641866 RepID=UPI00131A67DF|nr:AAA family ATPase [Granulicella sp. L60]